MEQDLLIEEKAKLLRIFAYHLEVIPAIETYHIYLVDCRGEKTLVETLKRIDKLLENKILKQKDIVTFPLVFADAIEEIGRNNFEHMDPIISNEYRYNFITGMRKEPSRFISGFQHYLGWVGIIASPVLKDRPLDRNFAHYFHNCRQFMEAYVPSDEIKFRNKINSIANEGRTIIQKRELEQFFGMAAIVRPELHRQYKMLYDEIMKTFGIITTEVGDYLKAQEKEDEK